MSDEPITGIYKNFGNYVDCNNSHSFYFDQDITERFHKEYYKKHSCILPFYYGRNIAKTKKFKLCTGDQSYLYDAIQVNKAFRSIVATMPLLPCKKSKISFGPVHNVETENQTSLVIKLPKELEL